MSGPNFVLDKSMQATTAIRKFRAVTQVGDESVKETDGANAFALGVCQEEVSAGDATLGRFCDIRLMGISRCVNGTAGALARRTRVATDSQGRVVAATTGQLQLGITTFSVAAQGDHVDVQLTPGVIAP